jgi:small-conductance mechanosensitive channel
MMRVLLLLAALAIAVARVAAPPAAAATPAGTVETPLPPLSAAEARQALEVLRDPRRRAMVEHTLDAIIRAGAVPVPHGATAPPPAAHAAPPAGAPVPAAKSPAPGAAAAKAPVQLNPDGLGAAVLTGASGFMANLSRRLVGALRTAQSVPLLWGWVVVMATNPLASALLRDAAWRVAVVFLLAFLAEAVARRLMRPSLTRLDQRAGMEDAAAPAPAAGEPPAEAGIGGEAGSGLAAEPVQVPAALAPDAEAEARAEEGQTEPAAEIPRGRDRLRRIGLAAIRFLLDLVPVLIFVLVGHISAATPLGGSDQPRLIILAVVDGYAVWRVVLCLGRMLLAPATPRLRLVRMSDALAAWSSRWLARIVAVAVLGYAIAQVGLLLGMSEPAYDGLLKLAGLINHIFVGTMVLQKRRAVRRWLRVADGAAGAMAGLRNAIAPVWHWIALSLLAGEWLVWAVELRHGYYVMIRTLAIVVVVAAGARFLMTELYGLLERAMHPGPDITARYPGLGSRLAVYHHPLRVSLRGAVLVVAAAVLAQLLGLGAITWAVGSPLGQRLVGGFGAIVFTVVLAVSIWEIANAVLQQHLGRLTREQHAARAARLRTLLPLLRAALFVVIAVIAGLTVLSQIGIDIGPLLAGAGIIGVAIGFGSQKLVQDLITGIFLLAENSIQVGDVVSVGGLSGVVENLSVRTIRLRDADGSVHVIPFSSVSTVTNMTKDFSQAVFNIGVAYKEDYDHVVEVLRALAREMRAEPEWADRMLAELEVWGLDQFGDSSIVIKCRLLCTPFGRWAVMREFNRRMKRKFDELGIEIPFPHRKLVVDSPIPLQNVLRNAQT